MHGVIFTELLSYAEAKQGKGAWEALLKKASLAGHVYLPVQEYPDVEAVALVNAASEITGMPVASVLEDFGVFIAPTLLKMYGHLLHPSWKSIDTIENAEGTVHTVVRIKNPGAKPPHLRTVRRGPDEVALLYTSPRRMCGLAIGIAKGMAAHFGEALSVTHVTCMHKGASQCEIVFRKIR